MADHPLDQRSHPSNPNVRSASMRKLGPDGASWTPTERRQKDRLMKQFTKLEGQAGNSDAFREGWDRIFGNQED
jgi:hypothetical protein